MRFLSKTDEVLTGDAILPEGETNIAKAKKARVITGDIFGKYEVTDQVADIRLLLAPLALDQVRTVRCLGLNYEQHAKEVRQACAGCSSGRRGGQTALPAPGHAT